MAMIFCFGHNLHLAVTNSIKSDARVKRALGVCRKIVSTFSYSWKKKRDLAEAQQQLNLPLHLLKSDCTTRWGSMQLMIKRILEQKDAIKQVLRLDSKTRHLCLTWQDIDVLESIQNALGLLDEFTDSLSGENEVTVSAIKAVLHILKTDVLVLDETNDSTLACDIKKYILEYVENKYDSSDVQVLLSKASYLDPRFCDSYLDDKEAVTDMILDEGVEVSIQQNPECGGSSRTCDDPVEPLPKKRKLGCWLAKAKPNPQEEAGNH